MRTITILILALAGLAVLSCKSNKSGMKSTPARAVQSLTEGDVSFELPDNQDFDGMDASVTNDNLLFVRVELPPSCKKGNGLKVAMTWDGRVRKSSPPIATLRFVHEQPDDCDAARTKQEFYFDLSPLDKFRGKGGKPVILSLPDFNAKLAYPKQPTE